MMMMTTRKIFILDRLTTFLFIHFFFFSLHVERLKRSCFGVPVADSGFKTKWLSVDSNAVEGSMDSLAFQFT